MVRIILALGGLMMVCAAMPAMACGEGGQMCHGHTDHHAHSPAPAHTGHHAGHGTNRASPSPMVAEYNAAMARMHERMNITPSGDADVDFIRGMIPHHEGAVDMARIVLKYGDDDKAKELARQIIVAQKAEIAWMHRWLERRQLSER